MMSRFAEETRTRTETEPKKSEANVVAIVVGVLWIVVVAIGGMVVGLLSKLTGTRAIKTKSGANYYDVVKPSIAPAPIVFSILWTILFVLFGAAGVGIVLPWL
jgi:tryptophan-rich sensory protein